MILRKQTAEDVLKEGIYGPKETKPEERRQFLGTIRERIIIALTKVQVKEKQIYPQVEQEMKKNPKSRLFLNGNLKYQQLSKYINIAKIHKISHTIVTNKEYDTEIGLVLAMDHAIDKADIYVEKGADIQRSNKKKKHFPFFSRILKRFKKNLLKN